MGYEYTEDVTIRPSTRYDYQFRATEDGPNILLPKMQALVNTLHGELQDCEDAIKSLIDLMDIESQSGYALDLFSQMIDGPLRQGMSDDAYKSEIQLHIAIMTSNGTTLGVVEALKRITAGTKVTWSEAYPAGINFVTNGTRASAAVLGQVSEILPAGVDATVAYGYQNMALFDTSDVATTGGAALNSNGIGFGDTGQHYDFTVSVTSGSATVTTNASETKDSSVAPDNIVYFNDDPRYLYTVLSVVGTTMTLTTNYTGATNAAATCKIADPSSGSMVDLLVLQ